MNFRDYLTIGEVVQKLQLSFADLSVSKLRFLEDEGLIAPERTDGGYRKYSRADIARIELILRLQREKFLPLAIIKVKLDEFQRGVAVAEITELLQQAHEAQNQQSSPDGFVQSGTSAGQSAATHDGAVTDGQGDGAFEELYALDAGDCAAVSVADMVHAEKIPENFFTDLKRFGIIEITSTASTMGNATVSAADAACVRAAWQLRGVGIEPRHLRMYATFADKESLIYEQLLRPTYRHKTPHSKEQLAQVASDIIRQSELLKRRLLQREIKDKMDDLL
ncbi:MAG: MerR family transcriptional regulator [Coriobacteriia bacterium]|nr:MerR family transcriptional regulator [Coriobacteriia bacterium]